MQVKPGLSSFPDDPVAAASSLKPLIDRALAEVPSHLHSCTPIALKATAGLRLLGDVKSSLILDAVRLQLFKTGFPIADLKDNDGVAVMDGRDEGVFAWITVNYLTQRIGGDRLSTSAIMDLGGGSTQIVFEPVDGAAVPDDPQYRFGMHQGFNG
jgi:guanosine-diphosphatase